MSEAAIFEALDFFAVFTYGDDIVEGLTVKVDVVDEQGVMIISDADAIEDALHIYSYTLPAPYCDMRGTYRAMFKTVGQVDIKRIPSAIVVRGNNTSPAGTLPIVSSIALTRAGLMEYITEFAKAEHSTPNMKLYDTLINQALKEISEKTLCYQRDLTNAPGAELTITGNSVTIGCDVIRVDRVEWAGTGNPLVRSSEVELDAIESAWRDREGTPSAWAMADAHTMLLSAAPSGTVTGMLKARAKCYLPELTDNPDVQNPLALIPAGAQLAPAYFVISRLPVPPVRPASDSRDAIAAAQWEIERRQTAREEHRVLYDKAITDIIATCDRKVRQPFSI